MGLILLYLFGALGISFLCSILEAVLLSTPMSFISMKEEEGNKTAKLLKKYKTEIDGPVAAILSLNTIAHTIGAAGVGAEAVNLWGDEYFGVISAIMYFMVYTDSAATVFGVTYRESFAFYSMDVVMIFIGSFITEIALAIIKRKNNKKSVSA